MSSGNRQVSLIIKFNLFLTESSFWYLTWRNLNYHHGEKKRLIDLVIPPAATQNRRSCWRTAIIDRDRSPTLIMPHWKMLSWLFQLWICFSLCCSCRNVSCSGVCALTVIARRAAFGASVGFSPSTCYCKSGVQRRGPSYLASVLFSLFSVVSPTLHSFFPLCLSYMKKY